MHETITIHELPLIETPLPEHPHLSREELEKMAANAALEGFEATGPARF